jgi:CRISPR/Cas system-associated exonuclease Cas4 (RecB family)
MSKERILTKSDFLTYCTCSKDFWLRKNKPDLYKKPELTLFFQKLIREGYEVERYAKTLFDDAVFQKQIKTKEGFYAELDMARTDPETGKLNIYEVKSSSGIKTDKAHNHIKDITFQTIVAERSGIEVGNSFIVHINKDYVRDGEINQFELLKIVDVTEKVNEEKEQVSLMMDEALQIMNKKEEDIDLKKCECIYKSHGQRCDSFSVLNPQVPEYAVQNIFQGKKIRELVDENIFSPTDVPDDFEMTDNQREKITLQKIGKPMIDKEAIEKTLNNFVYPVYFFDYESINKPVPMIDGYKTNQHLVFQFSLHKLSEDGELEHFEYLAEDIDNATKGLVDTLKEYLGPVGTILVWHESFEKGRNIELGKLHPEMRNFFIDMNNRIYDLKKIFAKDYLHPDFKGSASIKKVLPVILPKLSYKGLNVSDGTMAMTQWEKSTEKDLPKEEKEQLRKDLLEYCELDTFAMVELYSFLKSI